MSKHMTTPQVDFSVSDNMVPRYRYAKIVLNNLSSSSVPLNLTSQTLAEFKIPSSTVCNFSKSYIIYQYTIPASATAGLYTAVHEDGFDFQQIFFGSGSGLGIVDMQYCDRYKNAICPLRSTLERDFLAGSQDQMTQFYPSRQPGTTNVYPFSLDGYVAGRANASPINQTDNQHLTFSSAPNQAITVYRQIPLSILKDTFFAMDKDVVFGSDMYLRLWTNALQRMCFYTPSLVNPHINAVQYNNNDAVNATNFYLQLSIEENLDIRNSLLMSLAKGSIRFNIPYSYSYRFSQNNTSSSAAVSLTLTKNYGKSLNRILFVPFNGQEFTHHAYDHSNINGTKVQSLQSTLNGRPLSDSQINCMNPNANYDNRIWTGGVPVDWAGDWRQIREFTKQSCIQSYSDLGAKWIWCDAWGISPFPDEVHSGCPWHANSEGLSLVDSGDLVYSFQANTPAVSTAGGTAFASNVSGLILYLFCSFNRTLTIQADGIILSA